MPKAWIEEKPHLGELPVLPEPFDVAVMRQVGRDCLVSFEGRQYSVPFRYMTSRLEVRGAVGRVQILHDGVIVADHERGTERLLVIESAHYEGESTGTVAAPTPLGRMGKRLAEVAAMTPERRSVDLYADPAAVARGAWRGPERSLVRE